MLKRVEVFREGGFKDLTVNRFLVHDSPYMRVINFNFRAGQELPVTTMPLKASSPSWCWRAGGPFSARTGPNCRPNRAMSLFPTSKSPMACGRKPICGCW